MMDDKKLSAEERLILRQTARDAYFLCGQVENANRKFDTAVRVWEKIEEAKAEARRDYRKAYRWNLVAVGWWIFSAVMWVLR